VGVSKTEGNAKLAARVGHRISGSWWAAGPEVFVLEAVGIAVWMVLQRDHTIFTRKSRPLHGFGGA
jgi:hypothetical protein